MKHKYDEIMDKIEVSEEMKKRILSNIEQEGIDRMGKNEQENKAAESRKIISMGGWKKYLPVAACFVLLLIGVAAASYSVSMIPQKNTPQEGQEPDEHVAATGDIEEVASAKELSEKLGFPMEEIQSIPFEVIETAYVSYWGDFGEIDYRGEDQSISYRKQQGTEDVSGDYNVYGIEETSTIGEYQVTLKGDNDGYHLAVWSDGAYSYAISADEGVSYDEMVRMITEAR